MEQQTELRIDKLLLSEQAIKNALNYYVLNGWNIKAVHHTSDQYASVILTKSYFNVSYPDTILMSKAQKEAYIKKLYGGS